MAFNDHITPSFIAKIHQKPYAAISPTQPSLSAAGKTIFITGGATGIGYAIAQNFAAAGASTVILLARRASTLETASANLSSNYPKTQFLTYAVSIIDADGINRAFKEAEKEATNHGIDVLVTSAAIANTKLPVLEVTVEDFRGVYENNVIGNLNVIRAFLNASKGEEAKEKIILDVSSLAAWNPLPTMSGYGITKSAFTLLLRHVQVEHPEIRTHSFHPGSCYTEAAQRFGVEKDAIDWDDENLAGAFAVWLASPQAEFLKGRYTVAKWDVEDLIKNKEAFVKDPVLGSIWLDAKTV